MLYTIGAYVGKILLGALIGGLIPIIIAIVKKRPKYGLISCLVCALSGIIHPLAAALMGLICIIYFFATQNPPKSDEDSSE